MKNLLKISALFLGLGLFSFAGASSIDRFEIEVSPTKVKVGESIDVTLKAVDKSGNVVKDYTGEVLIFSQTDKEAIFPGILEENAYTFKAADAGVVKFENAVKFTKNGIQDVSVYDNANYDIFGYAEVEVSEGAAAVQTGDITIKYPEEGVTIGVNKIKVSGSTSKNHKVKIVLNGEKDFETISNAEGLFELEVNDLPSGENVFIAELLDADGKTIASSKEVFFKVESSAPRFRSITLDPAQTEYTPESKIGVTVEATSGLTSLNLIINDTLTALTEDKSSGKYTGSINAPKADGEYKIDVVMKNELGNETKESGVSIIKVKAVELLASTGEDTAPVEVNCADFQSELEVKNIKTIKLKSKSVISWDKVEKASSYNVYKKDRNSENMTLIENVTQNQYEIIIQGDVVEYDDFAVKAVFKDDVCNVESVNYSSMTKVQTGPKEMLFVLIALSLGAGVFFIRRKAA
ncbi:MAG: hypothetical protein AB7E37_04260 [Candidatus Altimarinota bacterium]